MGVETGAPWSDLAMPSERGRVWLAERSEGCDPTAWPAMRYEYRSHRQKPVIDEGGRCRHAGLQGRASASTGRGMVGKASLFVGCDLDLDSPPFSIIARYSLRPAFALLLLSFCHLLYSIGQIPSIKGSYLITRASPTLAPAESDSIM